MFGRPSRSETKAIFLPSGDQAGKPSSALLRVRLRASPHVGLTRKISGLPVRVDDTRSVYSLSAAGAVSLTGAAKTTAPSAQSATLTRTRLMIGTPSTGCTDRPGHRSGDRPRGSHDPADRIA